MFSKLSKILSDVGRALRPEKPAKDHSNAVPDLRRDRTFDGRVPPPTYINVETTQACNLRCRMCAQATIGPKTGAQHIDRALFREISEQVFPFADLFSPSVSGEPLMTKGFPEIVEQAERFGLRIEINTNAMLLNEARTDMLLPSLGLLIVSFDGAVKDTFESIRIGADFDTVLKNMKHPVRKRSELPPERRPVLGMNCVLMRQNVAELSAIVDLACDTGLDFLTAYHMFPFSPDSREESLVHHHDLAADCIRRALDRAEALGFPLSVGAMDRLTAIMAAPEMGSGSSQLQDVLTALSGKAVHQPLIPELPLRSADDPACDVARREAAWERASFVRPCEGASSVAEREPIDVCEFLWRRLYVRMDGTISTCCVPGAPLLGPLSGKNFQEIWDGPEYRALRLGLVLKKPEALCAGCQHVKRLSDPAEIDYWLQGRVVPEEDACLMPEGIFGPDERKAGDSEPVRYGTFLQAPIVEWIPVENAEGYEVEFSLDDFRTVAFSTSAHGDLLKKPEYALPDWAWRLSPVNKKVQWRAIAVIRGAGSEEVARGAIRRTGRL